MDSGSGRSERMSINVFQFPTADDPGLSPTHIASYHLPVMSKDTYECYMDVISNLASSKQPSTSIPNPTPTSTYFLNHAERFFRESEHNWILSFRLWVGYRRDGYSFMDSLQIITHANTLLSKKDLCPSLRPIDVPWSEWGYKNARCFHDKLQGSKYYNARIFGERFTAVLPADGSPVPSEVYVYDFNQDRVNRLRQSSSPSFSPWPRAFKGDYATLSSGFLPSDTIEFAPFESGSVIGRLPYSSTKVREHFEDIEQVLIDEEHVIILEVCYFFPRASEQD